MLALIWAMPLLSVFLYGQSRIWGPASGITTATAFTILGFSTGDLGMLLANVAFFALHGRNLWKGLRHHDRV